MKQVLPRFDNPQTPGSDGSLPRLYDVAPQLYEGLYEEVVVDVDEDEAL